MTIAGAHWANWHCVRLHLQPRHRGWQAPVPERSTMIEKGPVMTEAPMMTLEEIGDVAYRALTAAGTSPANAKSLAAATAATEADGIASHGLAYIPIYCEHVQCGKVDGQAQPVVSQPAPSVIVVDAVTGFAHPAIDLGFEALIPLARKQGVAALAVRNSYNCGVLGYHTKRLAAADLLAIGFTNAPASIAPVGGRRPRGWNQPIFAGRTRRKGRRICVDRPECQCHCKERNHETCPRRPTHSTRMGT